MIAEADDPLWLAILEKILAFRAVRTLRCPKIKDEAPTITVEQPDPSKPIRSPVSIRVRFQGDSVNISTLKVTYGYGLFAIDVTSKILGNRHEPSTWASRE